MTWRKSGESSDDMEIAFASETLHALANNFQLSCEKLGRMRAQRYLSRLQELRAAGSFADVADGFRPVQWSRTAQGGRRYSSPLDAEHRMICQAMEMAGKAGRGNPALPVNVLTVEILEIKRHHV